MLNQVRSFLLKVTGLHILYFLSYYYKMEYKRKDLQTKKDFYRRMAQIRKTNWANEHKCNEDENIKSHFMANEDSCSTDENKSKKIVKSEHRTEQRLRNRVAAQQSRERHRSYVEELEKKVKMYEELLDQQGALCKNCRKTLFSQSNQSQTIMAEEIADQTVGCNLLNSKSSQQQILNSYLDDHMIRIDNNGATSPFGIFFVVCMVAILAVCSFGVGSNDLNPRLLANYQSTVNQLITMQDTKFQNNKIIDHNPKMMEISIMQNKDQMVQLDREITPNVYVPPPVELMPTSSKNWTKYGDYICSQPSIIHKSESAKLKKGPEFLLLRTGRNASKPLKKLKVTLDQKQGHRINIQSNQWLEISSCFRGDL